MKNVDLGNLKAAMRQVAYIATGISFRSEGGVMQAAAEAGEGADSIWERRELRHARELDSLLVKSWSSPLTASLWIGYLQEIAGNLADQEAGLFRTAEERAIREDDKALARLVATWWREHGVLVEECEPPATQQRAEALVWQWTNLRPVPSRDGMMVMARAVVEQWL